MAAELTPPQDAVAPAAAPAAAVAATAPEGAAAPPDDASTGPPLDDPAARERRRLLRFLLRLGHLLLATGAPAGLVEATLRRVAANCTVAHFNVLALPTVVFVNFSDEEALRTEFTAEQGLVLRFDQIEAVYALADDAARTPIDGVQGLHRINQILSMAPRLGVAWNVLGHVLTTVGIGLVLRPSADVILAAAFFGLVVGVLKVYGRDRGLLTTLLPSFCAFVVALVAMVAAQHGFAASPIYVLVASLVTFLPGGTLATATVELAYGDVVSGGTRLVYGMAQLVFLALGMLAAASLVGLPAERLFAPPPETALRAWGPWIGTVLFALGHTLHYSGRLRTLPWLIGVLLVAQAGQQLGNFAFGGYMSGFVAALIITPVSYMVQYRLSGPPAMVTYVPALWLIVPGSLGLIGMAELVGTDRLAGIENFVATLFSIVAIGLGSVVGTGVYNALFDPVFQRAGTMADSMLRYLRLRR